jgi:hypothetical protein
MFLLHTFHKCEAVHQIHVGIPSFCSPYYNISITGAMVGSKSINAEFSAIVDSGTSFTALSDPMYTEITSSVSIMLGAIFSTPSFTMGVLTYVHSYQFNSQVKDKPSQFDSSLPFEFCYSVRYFHLATVPYIYISTCCYLHSCTFQFKAIYQSSKHKSDVNRWECISCQ